MAANKPSAEDDKTLLKNSILWRIYVIMLLMFIGSLIVILRIATIQYFQGDKLRTIADSLYIKERPVEAPRGNILAADGSLLATSLPYYDVRWDFRITDRKGNLVIPPDTFYKYVDTLAICLATYIDGESTIGGYRDRLIQAYERHDRYFLLRKNISYLELERMLKFPFFNRSDKERLLGKNRLSDSKTGLIVERISKRQYPFKLLANRTIGYIRTRDRLDNEGRGIQLTTTEIAKDTLKVGLENSYNDVLAGEEGKRLMQHVGNGLWIPIDDISQIEPRAGKDIITTIDINIQDITENTLLNAVRDYQADHGCAIVMEVATGDIKAIANIGASPDRTSFWEDYNYAIAEKGAPGSTFKLATMMALYEDGLIHLDDTVDLNYGKTRFFDEWMEDAAAHGLGMTTLERAFEVSSNVGIAKLAHQHFNQNLEGQKRFVQHLKNFMLDQPTGIKLEGEAKPFIKTPATPEWSGITVPWMSIGYELEVTPLQMLTFYNAVANNGKMMKPRLVTEIRSYGHREQEFKPEVLSRKIAKDETIKFAKYLLLRPVEGSMGTAKGIKTPQYRIAGKTGTAILNYEAHTSRGEAKRYLASFAGFFPADNPVYTCVVFVTNPRVGFYGGTVAAPIFRQIADKCYHKSVVSHPSINKNPIVYNAQTLPDLQVGYKSDLKYVMDYLKMPFTEEANTAWTVGRIQGDSLFLLMRNMQEGIVPNVVGMGLRDALYLLENRGIRVNIVGVGKVKSQSVKPGRSVGGVTSITLILG